jgi:Protein of unknown function (DUF1573)
MGRRITGSALALLVVAALAVSARAEVQNWAERMFTELGHDFGPVPRGAVVRHNFVMTNKYAESLTILDVRASCGCTSGRASSTTVAAGQTINIEAQMDTRNFVGRKATKLTVSFLTASGKSAEVQLAVVSNILPDIVLNPGTVDFGLLAKGQTATVVMTIERMNAPNWKFAKMIASPGLMKVIDAKLKEVERSESRVAYELTVTLKPTATAGPLRDEIRILTNDTSSPNVPVLVTAQIQGTLTASPAMLAMGRATAEGAKGRYLIRGAKPFTIKGIEGNGDGFSLTVDDDKSKTLHVLTVSFDPKSSNIRGDLRRSFRVVTDLADEAPIEMQASLRVEPTLR